MSPHGLLGNNDWVFEAFDTYKTHHECCAAAAALSDTGPPTGPRVWPLPPHRAGKTTHPSGASPARRAGYCSISHTSTEGADRPETALTPAHGQKTDTRCPQEVQTDFLPVLAFKGGGRHYSDIMTCRSETWSFCCRSSYVEAASGYASDKNRYIIALGIGFATGIALSVMVLVMGHFAC